MSDGDYYIQEERCGHLVTSETKKLWSVQISCLEQLKRICDKHNIQYFACGGTLLGAVRHKGYIPWDDDIDVCMLEADYKKFCQIAPAELCEPFFFQNYKTQKGFGPSISRIRRSDTTGCTAYEKKLADEEYNCGIFIDIFPMFSVSSKKALRVLKNVSIMKYKLALVGYEHMKMQEKQGKSFDLCVIYWRLMSVFMNHEKLSDRFLKACSVKNVNTKYIAPVSFTGFSERFIYERAWFDNSTNMPFEYTDICCPDSYDQILRQLYGDYSVFVKGSATHSMAIVDTETSYKERMSVETEQH